MPKKISNKFNQLWEINLITIKVKLRKLVLSSKIKE